MTDSLELLLKILDEEIWWMTIVANRGTGTEDDQQIVEALKQVRWKLEHIWQTTSQA